MIASPGVFDCKPLQVEVDHPDLPPEIKAIAAEAIAGVWRQATETARTELAAIRIELQADQDRARHEAAQAQQAATQAQATVEQLRAEVSAAHEATHEARVELEAERRAHAGAVARLQELQAQLEQVRAQQQRQQESFSADLGKAREAVEAGDRRRCRSGEACLAGDRTGTPGAREGGQAGRSAARPGVGRRGA